MINYIIFDVGEVLIEGIRDIGEALAEKHNIEIADRTFAHVSPTPLLTPLVKEFFAGSVTEDAYWDEVVKTYPQLGTKDELKRLVRDNFVEVKGTREIVVKLKNLGYKLGVLSVHGKEWIEYCEQKYDFHKLFDQVSFSYHAGNLKPDKESFLEILEKLKAPAQQTLFIDDSETNIKAAEALGIQGLLFTSAEDLNANLAKILSNYQNPTCA